MYFVADWNTNFAGYKYVISVLEQNVMGMVLIKSKMCFWIT